MPIYIYYHDYSFFRLEHYREYLIYNIPSLRYLDFEKIKTKDRELANSTMENFNENDD
ncbi:hypothetical protein PFFVO_05923, partial [Plasmodium falciparum Vietnam Oak-Knoll (FVO)]